MKNPSHKLILAGAEAVLLLAIGLMLAMLIGNLALPARAAAPSTLPANSLSPAVYNPAVVGALTSQLPLIPVTFVVNLPLVAR